MQIRLARSSDLPVLAAIEAACFPPEEAATEQDLAERLKKYSKHFWLLELDQNIVSFINGMVTDEPFIRDEMFANVQLHNEAGAWQAIFGVNTLPQYRKRGYAAQVMEQVIQDAKQQGRKGCILTCKEGLIPYYERFGYRNLGKSESVHGGAVWYDMQLHF